MSQKTTSVATALNSLSHYLVEQPHPQDSTISYRIKPEFVLHIIVRKRKKYIQSIHYNTTTNTFRIKVTTRDGFYTTLILHGNHRFTKTITVSMLLTVNIIGGTNGE